MSPIRELTARTFAVAGLCLALASSCVAAQDAFSAFVAGSGDAYTWFTPTTASVDVDASVSLRGSFELAGDPVRFSADGTAVGEATIDMVSLGVTAWIVVDACGISEDGRSVRVRGGLLVTGAGGALTGSSGTGGGRFDFEVTLGAARFRATGTAEGSASGQLVPSDVEFAMKATGAASAVLDGAIEPLDPSAEDCRTDVLDAASWPHELIDLLPDSFVDDARDPIQP